MVKGFLNFTDEVTLQNMRECMNFVVDYFVKKMCH